MTHLPKPIITEGEKSTVTIEGEIPQENWEKHRTVSLKALGSELSVPGFRKGHAPEDILVKYIGEYELLREMAERALAEHYGTLLVEHRIDAIGRPEVTITKLSKGNPLGFKITTTVLPKVTLPDYTSLAALAVKDKASEDPIVTDEEAETFINNLLSQRVKAAAENDGKEAPEELTDEVAKSIGDFKDAADMRARVKEGMLLDKKRMQREERRMAIIDALLKDTKVTIPDILVESELSKILAQFENDLTRMGIEPKDYREKVGKDEAALRAEFRGDAEKRAKIQLILNEIGVAEKLTPSPEEVQKEVDHLLAHHPPHEGHDEARERESALIYVTTVLTNEKVLAFLEQQKDA
ncbi:MAG TPA: trigger factor [Candidatus Paceibacterota bacterium]|nr:trigger factor [Candidatus Paceibacterota bacterium]